MYIDVDGYIWTIRDSTNLEDEEDEKLGKLEGNG